jgi:mandelate racemase
MAATPAESPEGKKTAGPTIRTLRVRPVNVPLPKPHPTAGGLLTSAPVALIDLTADDGTVGRSYVFTYTTVALLSVTQLLRDLEPLIAGLPLAPLAVGEVLQSRFRLLGAQGFAQMAIGGIDMALWDACANAAGMPLHRLLGAAPKRLPAYLSLGMMSAHDGIAEARHAVEMGFQAVKFKIGGATWRDDRAFVGRVREAIGPDVALMVDYNQSLGAAEAVRRGRAIEEYDLTWLEEPCRMDDDAGHAVVAAALATPVLFGENWWSAAEAARAIAARALDEVMLDVMKIGGVSGWTTAAGLAATAGMRLSSHLFTEFSAQLIAASPSGRFVEWLDLVSPILHDPLTPKNGFVQLDDRPGAGLLWNEPAVEAYAFSGRSEVSRP